jgi:hypothetical protein
MSIFCDQGTAKIINLLGYDYELVDLSVFLANETWTIITKNEHVSTSVPVIIFKNETTCPFLDGSDRSDMDNGHMD